MFCKKCGQQNPDGAKFCFKCGSAITMVSEREAEQPLIANTETLPEPNKLNIFQKIAFLNFLFWLTVILFYIPYRSDRSYGEEDKTIYDVLWSGRSHLLWGRLAVQLGVLVLVSYLIVKYLKRFTKINPVRYKYIGRRELYIFFGFIVSAILYGVFLLATNFINEKRDKSFGAEIVSVEQQISSNSKKRQLRQEFWNASLSVFNLNQFEGRLNRYWDFIIVNMEDGQWLKDFYIKFQRYEYGYYPDENGRIVYGQYPYNVLRKQLNLNSPPELKDFVRQNTLNETDFKKDDENKELAQKANILKQRKEGLTIYDYKALRRNSLVYIVIVFGLLYVIRPLYWFVKSLFVEIK